MIIIVKSSGSLKWLKCVEQSTQWLAISKSSITISYYCTNCISSMGQHYCWGHHIALVVYHKSCFLISQELSWRLAHWSWWHSSVYIGWGSGLGWTRLGHLIAGQLCFMGLWDRWTRPGMNFLWWWQECKEVSRNMQGLWRPRTRMNTQSLLFATHITWGERNILCLFGKTSKVTGKKARGQSGWRIRAFHAISLFC